MRGELDPEAIYATRPGQSPTFDAESPAAGGAIEVIGGGIAGPTRRALRRFVREKAALVALAYLLLLVIATLTYKRWWPYSPTDTDFSHILSPPVSQHWLGTDRLGRDIVARLLAGAGVSLRASFQVIITALVVALPLGLASGYIGGWFDNTLMRVMDGILSIPALILALAIAGVLGPGLTNAMIALTIVFIPSFTRLVRAQTLAVREETFIEASQSIGSRPWWLLAVRVLPNVAPPVIVQASLALGSVLLAEATLSFLGVGLQPPKASWGVMLSDAYEKIFTHPWQIVYPGVAIALTVLAFNLLGDGLRDAFGIDTVRRKRKGRTGITRVVLPKHGTTPGDVTPGRTAATATDDALLAVDGLTVEFETDQGVHRVVEGVSFTVRPGEIVGLVGESGSGKTVTSLSVLRLIPSPPGRIIGGSIRFNGTDLLRADFDRMRRIRGAEIAMVFQDPMSSLNPAFTVGNQLTEAVLLHEDVSHREARARAVELLSRVGIPDPVARLDQYPHEFSGGMRQRVMIAMALICRPKLLIADEPTTALDVTVQAQVLELLRDIQAETGMAVVLVTHDLGVVAGICDRITVLYAGQVVETAEVHDLFRRPRHPYTAGLLAALPQRHSGDGDLASIPGRVPPPDQMPEGCRFHPRCPYAVERLCTSTPIAIEPLPGDAVVRCVRHTELDLPDATTAADAEQPA
jgi:oligopeptide/dipeptide ABC transporter ATP-binding protein